MIAPAMVSICAFVIGPPFLRVFFGTRQCVVGRPAALVNRQHVCAINSEAGPGIGLNGLAHSDAHTDTSAQTMLRAEMLLRRAREMQQGYYCGKCNTALIV